MNTIQTLLGILLMLGLVEYTQANTTNLYEYEGRYEYIEDTQLNIVVGPENLLLYAVIEGARYPLRPIGKDTFLNIADSKITFLRDNQNHVLGYMEQHSALYKRLSDNQQNYAQMFIAKPAEQRYPYLYRHPSENKTSLPVKALEKNNPLHKALEKMTNAIYQEEYPYTQSVLVYQNDALVFEEYFYEFDANTQHQMRSATKTLSALLVGIAIDKGLINSIDQPIWTFFQDEFLDINDDERKKDITLHHLLSMQSGFACNDYDMASPGNENKKNESEDWVKFMLNLPMQNTPGEVGIYCSGNVTLINRIIELVSGKPLTQFAKEVLFTPLGIIDYQWEFRPDRSSINNFNQAYMLPSDMLKLGLLIKNKGIWDKQMIVSTQWINNLTQTQSEINGTPYGYLYWLRYYYKDGKKRIEIPQISGNGGQKVILLKQFDTVIVMTGGNYNAQSHTNELLDTFIVDALHEQQIHQTELSNKL